MNSGLAFDAALRRGRGVPELVGVDEAGRGPLAGPVVVAAVRLGPEDCGGLEGVRDSKLLSAGRRESLFDVIRRRARAVSLAWAHPRAIERDNILSATLGAMRRAALRAAGSGSAACLVVVDGNREIPGLLLPQLAVVAGDRRSLAVACASVVAKVVRDRWMRRLDRNFPGYGFLRHKGYGTAAHLEALRRLGPSPLHRRTYAPVRELLPL